MHRTADEHHFQSISRVGTVAPTPVLDYDLEWDYNAKVFDCKINVGIDNGMTLRMCPMQLTKEMYEKVAESNPNIVERFWSKANAAHKRKASHEYLRLWALAAVACGRQAFEGEIICQTQKKTDC